MRIIGRRENGHVQKDHHVSCSCAIRKGAISQNESRRRGTSVKEGESGAGESFAFGHWGLEGSQGKGRHTLRHLGTA